MTTARARLIYSVATLFLVVLFLEGALNGLAAISDNVARLVLPKGQISQVPMFFPDERLAFRPNPEFAGHDASGFRNAQVPESADIVVFGDSQTYGHGVSREQAWPMALGRASSVGTYSLAFNGFGPTQSLVLLDRALELKPRVVLQAFYAGNDLFDGWDAVYGRGVFPEFESSDSAVLTAMAEAEAEEPLRDRIDRLFQWQPPGATSKSVSLRAMLRRHSRLYGLLRSTRKALQGSDVDRQWALLKAGIDSGESAMMAFEDGHIRTAFTAEYRLCALELEDPRISEGLRVGLEVLDDVREGVESAGAQFVVVWIPTKEYVFRGRVAARRDSYEGVFAKLIEREERVRERVAHWCEAAGLLLVDVGPGLEEALEMTFQPYPASQDGHPNAIGHAAIADVVAEELRARGIL